MKPINNNINRMLRTLCLLFLPLVVLASCGKEREAPPTPNNGTPKQLSISTSVFTRAVDVTTQFERDNAMNLFVKTEGSTSANDHTRGVKATFDGAKWNIAPKVDIEPQGRLYVYAAYPFEQSNDNAAAYPININDQIDYLYSGSAIAASYDRPNIELKMNHALAIMAFVIEPQDYDGAAMLETISVEGSEFYVSGTINIGNGQIDQGNVGKYTYRYDKTLSSDDGALAPQFFVLPTKSDGSNLTLTFRIDGKDYVETLPAINIAQGWKYVFQLSITPVGIHIFADKTESISLNTDPAISERGRYSSVQMVYSSNNVSLPQITGANMSGTIYWSQTEKSPYAYPATHTFADDGQHQISIDLWNAKEISFDNLEGLDEVDLSKF